MAPLGSLPAARVAPPSLGNLEPVPHRRRQRQKSTCHTGAGGERSACSVPSFSTLAPPLVVAGDTRTGCKKTLSRPSCLCTSLSFPPSTSSHPHSGHGSLHLGPSRWFDRASTSPVHLEASQHCLQLASRIDTQSRLPARFVVFCLPVTPALQHRICLRPCTVLPIHPRSNLLPSRRQCHICLSFQRILLSAPLFTSAPRLRASSHQATFKTFRLRC